MIVEYEPAGSTPGKITHHLMDPVPKGMEDIMTEAGSVFLSFPPIPWPEVQRLDENDQPMFTEETYEPLIDPLTGEQMLGPDQVVEEDIMGDGNLVKTIIPGEPLFEVIPGEPIMYSPGSDFVACDIMTDYILDGQITPRPVFDAPDEIVLVADGVDTYTLMLPDPCEIRLDGETHVVTGGSLPLSSDMPAEYTLELVQWPYIEKTIKVIANAPL